LAPSPSLIIVRRILLSSKPNLAGCCQCCCNTIHNRIGWASGQYSSWLIGGCHDVLPERYICVSIIPCTA
ncbi:hypothetical protein RSAG8_12211, partial [Rhizoctonia solani AG-8 WAC10335]